MVLKPPRLTPEEYVHFFSAYDRVSPLLISDYDGTLAPFRRRGRRLFRAQTQDLLGAICDAGGEVILVSGRCAEEVRQLVSLPVEIWGATAWKDSADGLWRGAEVSPEALSKMNEFSWLFGDFPNRSVEVKYSGIASSLAREQRNCRPLRRIFARYNQCCN